MSRRDATIPADYFEGLYRNAADPWSFRTSDYEREKYETTLAALTQPRYAEALEVGCSIGVFTRALARRCDKLLAIDLSETALAAARQACGGLPVTFEQRAVPGGFPDGRFALIVLSEVLYYLDRTDLRAMAQRCMAARPDEMVLCHWLGETDYPLTGQEAADIFVAAAREHGYRHDLLHEEVYRLDRLSAG